MNINQMQRESEADQILATAEAADLTIPADVQRAHAAADRLGRLAFPDEAQHEPLDLNGDLEAQLDARAAAARLARERAEQADLARDQVSLTYVTAVTTALDGWIETLRARFTKAVDEARSLAPSVPNVTPEQLSNVNPEAFTAWQAFARIAGQLDTITEARRAFGMFAGEQPSNAFNNATLALVAAVNLPGDATDAAAVTEAHRTVVDHLRVLGEQRPDTQAHAWTTSALNTPASTDPVGRWLALLAADARGQITLGLATRADLAPRLRVVGWWSRVPFRGVNSYSDAASDRAADSTTKATRRKTAA